MLAYVGLLVFGSHPWWKVVLMPGGDRTHLMASEVPLMYGIVAEVVTLGGCEREVNWIMRGLGVVVNESGWV